MSRKTRRVVALCMVFLVAFMAVMPVFATTTDTSGGDGKEQVKKGVIEDVIMASSEGITKQDNPANKLEAILKNATFTGLTQIIAETNVKLDGITATDIEITAGSYTIPSNLITKVEVADNKLTVNLDPAAFAVNSSVGATIATKAFGSVKAGSAVVIARSGDALDPEKWGKARVPETKRKHLMLVADFSDAQAKDNTGKNLASGRTDKYVEGNLINGHVLKTAQDYYDWFMPSVTKWYKTSSYGVLDLQVSLVKNPDSPDGVFRCKKPLANYIEEGSGDTIPQEILEQAKQVLADYPGGPYDCVYVVTVENAGLRGSWANPYYQSDKKLIGRNDLHGLVKIGYDAYENWMYKVVVHETGHILGMIDYYTNWFSGYGNGQCDPVTGRPDYYPLVGHYSLMGFTNGPAPDLFAQLKRTLGWIRDDQVDVVTSNGTTTHQLTPIETAGGTKVIYVEGKGVKYAIEYRQAAGVDNTGVDELSTDPNPAYPNKNWTHTYGTFHSPGILLYKFDMKGGNLTVVDLVPGQGAKLGKDLGTELDYSVLGATSGVFSYTDASSGIKITLDKETNTVDTVTVTKTKPVEVKPVLSEARFIDGSTVEFKTDVDLRGTNRENIVLKNGNVEVSGVNINQIMPGSVRITFDKGQFKNTADMEDAIVYTKAFSSYEASEAVKVSKVKALTKPVLSDAKFNSLTELVVKSNTDLSLCTASDLNIKIGKDSIVDSSKIESVKFDTATNLLTVKFKQDQFVKNAATKNVAISTRILSNYIPNKLDAEMAKFGTTAVEVTEASADAAVTPIPPAELVRIDVDTSLAKKVYCTGDSLNVQGIKVTGNYSDNSKESLTITAANIKGFDSLKTAKIQKLTVAYGGRTAAFHVKIEEKPVSIKITKPAAKQSYYVRDTLDISGLQVTGTFKGGAKRIIEISPADISGFNSSKASGKQVLIITYGGRKATYAIAIRPEPAVTFDTNAYYKIVVNNGKGIVDGDSGNENIVYWSDYTIQYPDNCDAAKWKFVAAGEGYYKLYNKARKDYIVAVSDTAVIQGNDTKDDYSCWIVLKEGDSFIIKNKATRMVLTVPQNVDNTPITQSSFSNNEGQLWKIVKM